MLHIPNKDFNPFCKWLEKKKHYTISEMVNRVAEKPHHFKKLYKEFLKTR